MMTCKQGLTVFVGDFEVSFSSVASASFLPILFPTLFFLREGRIKRVSLHRLSQTFSDHSCELLSLIRAPDGSVQYDPTTN